MRLIIGLGNPGHQYFNTRHNFGFLAINYFRDSLPGLSDWESNEKFRSLISEGKINGEKILLAKPQTFMNNSGRAVKLLADYYKLTPADIIVLHDDLDLSLGEIKISHNASAGGHRGVASVIQMIGAQNFTRIRLGIKQEKDTSPCKGRWGWILAPLTQKLSSSAPLTQRGDWGVKAEKFVLQKFNEPERPLVQQAAQQAKEAILIILTEGLPAAQNKFN